MRKLLIDPAGLCVNVVLAGDDYVPPQGFTAVAGPAHVGLGWSLNGEQWSAPAVTAPVPETVTNAQARVALIRAGLFPAVNAAVQAAGGEALAAWEYSNTVSRSSALVATLGAALQLSEDQIDNLFRTAETITF